MKLNIKRFNKEKNPQNEISNFDLNEEWLEKLIPSHSI